jgi:pimeloyl-ACP methyl ester carboxylesterase
MRRGLTYALPDREAVMATCVLVHGAWHGSWCWKRVRRALQSAGHEVFTPTLTGVGERSHQLSPSVDLSMHVADVVNLIRFEELTDIVLCGHSYGGCVVGGVAEQLPQAIRSLVYLDAFVLENGQSVFDTFPPGQVEATPSSPEDDWKVAPIPAEVFNVNLDDRAWVDRQCTMQSAATFQEKVVRTGRFDRPGDTTYILATGWEGSFFPKFHERAQGAGWNTLTMACGHDVMLDRPEELARTLVGIAERRVSVN